jgi:ankyrin repeat protein
MQPPSATEVSRIYAWFTAVATADWNEMQNLLTGGLCVDVSHPLRQTTALMEATRQGRNRTVEWLLHHGAAPALLAGLRATSALHIAIKMQQWEIAERLAILAPTAVICDHAGRTPLHMLSMTLGGDTKTERALVKLVDILVQKGAGLDALDGEGISALHYCIVNDLNGMAERLLIHGANPNIMSPESKVTPLTIAALENQRELVALLLRYGASANHATQDGKTAIALMPELQYLPNVESA